MGDFFLTPLGMAVVLCCPCRNISLHLDRAPSAQETPFWLSECFKLPKGVGKAALSTVAATTKQVEILCAHRVIERDTHQWSCLICLNCETFVYAERSTGGSPLYINMILQTKPDRELGSQRMLSSFYSPVWKIILKDEEEQSNSVLGTPTSLVSILNALRVLTVMGGRRTSGCERHGEIRAL